MAMGVARLCGIGADGKGEVRGNFLHFLLNLSLSRTDYLCMGKNTISAGFLVLACGDVIALSQFSLSLWEAIAFGALCAISYGMGIWAGLAE